MTLQEISELQVQDVQEVLESRLFDSENPEAVPTQAELEAELIVYKAELTAAETERLRVKNLSDRIEALDDANYAHAIISPDVPNAALHRKNTILTNADHVEAEANLVALEAKDAELKAAKDSVAYIADRKTEYPSIEELIVAIFEEDQAAIDELKARRAATKLKFPKG